MSRLLVAWFSFAVAVLFLIPIVPDAGPGVPDGPVVDEGGEAAYVRIHIPGADAASLGADVEIVETYDSFVLARARPGTLSRLEAEGLTIAPEDTFTLHVNGYAFDTRGSVRVPAALAAAPVREGQGYFLVQFVGPVKEEWRWRLESFGPRVVGYVNNNAYVVSAAPDQLASLETLREVQWIGAYHPAFRISPDLLSAEGTVAVNVITFAEEAIEPVVAALNKMGLRFQDPFSTADGILVGMRTEDFGLLRVRLDASLLVPLARLAGVRYIEAYEQMQLFTQQEQYVLQTNASADGPGVRRIWDLGVKGEGQTIAIDDSGLDYDHTMFRHSQTVVTLGSGATSIYNQTNLARRKVVRYLPMSGFRGVDPYTGGDPNAIKDTGDQFCFAGAVGHGSATSSSAAGDDTAMSPTSINDGMAPNSKLIMVDIGSADASGCDVLTYIPDDYADMFGSAYAQGARIFSNSWGGTASTYTFEASMADRFIWNFPDALILFANGNNPPNPGVGSPATAKSVLSVSGSASSSVSGREQMGAASRGPTADLRRKPDITTTFSTTSPGGVAQSDGNPNTLNSALTGFAGTSYATPLAAGMAALARQYYTEGWYPRGLKNGVPILPSAALLKATMVAGSVPMQQACPGGDNFYPNNAQGWGRLWLDEALYFAGDAKKLFVVDHTGGITTGDTLEYRVRVAATAGRFRAFLAWSDFPGLEGANPALVNNLDLEVIDPNSVSYKGNVRGTCSSGQTTTGASFDLLNNLEGVVRLQPAVGEWRIRIVGTNVPMGPQKFALVVLADLDRTYGTVAIDRTLYNEADTITMTVTDSDAAAVNVLVTSNTEPAGETIALSQPVAGANIWRGTIPTNYGVPAADGLIQVSHGDTVTVTYNDVSPAHASTATARVEIDPPAISNVQVTGLTNAAATITWTTDRPADGTVFYGTTPALGSTAADTTVTTLHAVTLTNLVTNTLYYYDVASSRAGRSARDSNDGLHYSFRTTDKAEILVVLGDSSFTPERLAMYRSALAGASWAWNEWDVARQGDPTLPTLREYKAVLWQVGLEQYPPFSDAQVILLTAYINGGGRIMASGHDVGWAACDFAGSTYSSASRCNFVRSLLKGDYLADPATFSLNNGFAADPISGAYTAGVTYVPHRSGGAGDELNPLNAGGITSAVWRTNTFDPVETDGFRWESTANNGTATAGCVWCGTRSRVASYFFEFTGINFVAGQANNPQRTDILNKTIVWLLGRSPPVVRVTLPGAAAGEVYTTNTLAVSWQRSQPLSAQEIWYSRDSGASWTFVKAVGTAANSDNVDISNVAAWPNGDRYLIRIVAVDTGTPTFTSQDASDFTFRINRAGGDLEGPVVRPGSLRIAPNPARDGRTVWFNATVDDTLRGLSNLFTAEFFIRATEPTVGEYGTGTPMTAVDGAYSAPVEPVTGSTTASWAVGSTQTVWVHGQDDATPTRNWGPFSSRSFLVIPASAGVPPNPATNGNARLVGATFADVRISWTIPGGPAIDKFQVYFSSTYSATKAGYALLMDNIAPTATSWDHAGAGADTNTYFYYVRAVNGGGGADSVEQSAKFTRTLATAGWNLVSIPLTLQDTSISSTLQTMSWRTARTHVASDAADPWKAYSTVKPGGDLRTVSAGMALWVDLVTPDDFTIAGQVPTSTTLAIVGGTWNFVGYASFAVRAANVAFPGALGVNQLEVFSAAPQYYLTRVPLTWNLEPGKGYWVYATTGGSWTLTN